MRKRQQGLATVEFAIIGALMLLLLLAVIEFGRLIFVWNSATEATRRGVRVAVVCPINDPAIANVTVFNDDSTSGPSAALYGLDSSDVVVRYLMADGITEPDCIACECDDSCGTTDSYADIKYVQVGIVGYQHTLLLPFGVTLPMPPFTTTLPRESLGVVPGVGTQCTFG